MNGKVLITGGHGNLGSWLTKEFCKSGYDVYVLTRSAKTKIPNIQYKLIEADVTDYEGLSKKLDLNFDFCIHTASFNEYFLKDYPKKALDIKPDYVEAYSNLSIALKEQGKFDEAVASCQKALDIRPNYAEAHNNLGVTLKDLGKPDEAIASFKKAISFKPGYSEAINNLCLALRDQGKMDEAILLLESNLENGPVNVINSDSLTSILNHHMPSAENPGRYSKAQEALQHVMPDYTAASGIGDETVRQLYQECQSILASYKLNSKTDQLQIYRGEHINLGCVRHLRVFKTFNIIPEFCFGCYKVSIEPRTVMELIKLMLVFDILAIPNDRARKCMVEVRPDISGAYKGYIYCKTLEEGKEIAAIVQNIVGEKISKEITISVKRGCSEYSVAYPEYGQIKNNDHQQMKYNEEWRENEEFADNNLIGHVYPPVFNTSNHSGMTLRDVFIMHKWLEYAATIGDLSYLEVSKSPVQKMQIKRPSFQVVDKIKEVKGDSVN
ncbi:MAG: tetratricopeptide repeat protein [Rhodospirillales bacterium]|nr:tetratricopeptide repeat protein [Rhodospirillales bacterium]